MLRRRRGVADTSLRLCHQEMLERAREKERRGGGGGSVGGGSETRRAMKHELARKMKRASEFVRPEMQWQEARRLMLEHGVALLHDMDPRDAEQARPPAAHAHTFMRILSRGLFHADIFMRIRSRAYVHADISCGYFHVGTFIRMCSCGYNEHLRAAQQSGVCGLLYHVATVSIVSPQTRQSERDGHTRLMCA